MADLLNNPRCHLLGGFVGNQLVASCTLTILSNLTRGARPYALIENIVTHADFRRQGWGHVVLHHALRIAKEADCYKVMLMSGRDESVCHFYEAAGFSRTGKQAFVLRND